MAKWILPKGELSTLNGDGVTREQGEIAFDTTNDQIVVVKSDTSGAVFEALNSFEVTTFSGAVADSVTTTDASGDLESTAVTEGQLLGRAPGGALEGQKLHESMIDTNSIPYDRLETHTPGYVLGVPETNVIDPPAASISAIAISDIKGVQVTSSDTAPDDPSENDLWYYNGEEDEDNARLYIYQDGLWIDASPGVVNNNPGPQGDPGEQGEKGDTGDSVQSLSSVEEDGVVKITFFTDEEMSADAEVGTVDIDTSLLPTPELTHGVFSLTLTTDLTADNDLSSFQPVFADGVTPNSIAQVHSLIFNGLMLIAGVDYEIVNVGTGTRNRITFMTGAITAINADDSATKVIYLNNFAQATE